MEGAGRDCDDDVVVVVDDDDDDSDDDDCINDWQQCNKDDDVDAPRSV